MNPMLKRLLATAAVPAQENLVQDAVDANNTAGTTDPEQAQKNVDFQAELDRLKELQGDATGGDAGAADPTNTDPAAGAAGAGADDAATADADAGAGDAGQATDPAADNADPAATPDEGGEGDDKDNKDGDNANPDEDPGNGEANDQEDGETSEDDAEIEELNEDAEVAQEALRVAAEALGAMARAHELGFVKTHHVSLFDTALESQYISLGTQQRPALSTESDIPESSSSKLKYAAGRIKEFLKQILAKIREYYGKVMQWVKAFFQGWREHYGQFEKNTEGLLKRIAYLKGKERPAEEIEALAEKKPISLSAVATSSEAPTLDSVGEAIKLLTAVGNGVVYSVSEDAAYGRLVDLVSRVSEKDMAAAVTGTENAITAERMFRISGSSSIFNNSTLYKNTRKTESSYKGMVDFVIEGLPGLVGYRWTLAPEDGKTIDEVIHHNNLYGFGVQSARALVQGSLFTSLDDCEAAMQLLAPLMKELVRFKDIEKIITATQSVFVKNEEAIKQVVELVDIPEDDKIKVLMVHSTAQSAYTNLFVKSVSNHVKVVENTISTLQRWVAESLNIIAPEKNPQA